jgi:transmembrane sensor
LGSAVALSIGIWLWPQFAVVPPEARAAFSSLVVSAPEKRTLPDGSVVEIKGGAVLAVDFTVARRRVALHSGEAYFQVAKSSVPFVVVAGGVEVRAVGTAFCVQLGSRAVEIIVTSGHVALERPSAAAPVDSSPGIERKPWVDVPAGNRVVIELATRTEAGPPPVIPLTEAESTSRMSWRVPRLEFSGTPLSDAIAMFNRHGASRLILAPALGQLRISGTLRADDTDSLLLLLKNEFGIEPEHHANGDTLLRR